jgi:hypothetical protein
MLMNGLNYSNLVPVITGKIVFSLWAEEFVSPEISSFYKMV